MKELLDNESLKLIYMPTDKLVADIWQFQYLLYKLVGWNNTNYSIAGIKWIKLLRRCVKKNKFIQQKYFLASVAEVLQWYSIQLWLLRSWVCSYCVNFL
jgi:hypothetical protein